MKRSSKWLKVFNGLLSSVLALLGYSCNVLGETPDEYGTPYARYEVKGKVTDKESQAAVEGARVIVKPLDYETGIALRITMTRFIRTRTAIIFIRKRGVDWNVYVWYAKTRRILTRLILPR